MVKSRFYYRGIQPTNQSGSFMRAIQGRDLLSFCIIVIVVASTFYIPLLQERSSSSQDAYTISCGSDSSLLINHGTFSGTLNITRRETALCDYWSLTAYHERRALLPHQNLSFSVQTSFYTILTYYAVNESLNIETLSSNYTAIWNQSVGIAAGFVGAGYDMNHSFKYDTVANESQVYVIH